MTLRRKDYGGAVGALILAALCIRLGIWQLQRAKWKEGLLARYQQAEKLPPITWPTVPLTAYS